MSSHVSITVMMSIINNDIQLIDFPISEERCKVVALHLAQDWRLLTQIMKGSEKLKDVFNRASAASR